LTTNDRDVCELWTEYLTWITAEARRRVAGYDFQRDDAVNDCITGA
jgi:hypothetical protein